MRVVSAARTVHCFHAQGKSASDILNTIDESFEFITTSAPDAFADPTKIPSDYEIWRPIATEVFVSERLGLNWGHDGGGGGDVPLKTSVQMRIEAALRRDLAFFGVLLREIMEGVLTPPPRV